MGKVYQFYLKMTDILEVMHSINAYILIRIFVCFSRVKPGFLLEILQERYYQ